MSVNDDQPLLLRWNKDKDIDALARLIEKRGRDRKFFAIALRWTKGCVEDAQDVLQEVTILMLNKIAEKEYELRNVDGLYYRFLSRYGYRFQLKKAGRQYVPLKEHHSVEDYSLSALEMRLIEDLEKNIVSDDGQQKVWELSKQGYKPQEISDITGQKPNTVAQIISRIRKKLRAKFDAPIILLLVLGCQWLTVPGPEANPPTLGRSPIINQTKFT
jgi:DNA-directed RNA polymerase specialized sigma24 family protein